MTAALKIERPKRNTPTATQIQEQAVILILTIHRVGNHRKVNSEILTTEADKALFRVTKQLMDHDKFKAVEKHLNKVKSWLTQRALPSPFKDGTYTISLQLYLEVDDALVQFERELKPLVDDLLSVYDEIKADAQRRLGKEFRAAEYPTPERLREAFALEWRYLALQAPEQLRGVDANAFAREQRKLQAMWEDSIEEMRMALRVGVNGLVNDMLDRLETDDKGKLRKPGFKPSALLSRFEVFFDTFEKRNLTNDVALAELVKQARGVLKGVSTNKLKELPSVQERVREGFAEVQKSLENLVPAERTRRIILD